MNKNNNLTVTLVEQISSGHHTEYLLHVISEFSKNNIKVHFVGAPDICDQIANKVESVTPLLLDANCDSFRRELRRISFCKKVFQLAKKNNSDLVHFLYVDRLLRALFFSQPKFNCPIIATLHWAYMLNQFTQTKKQKLMALLERTILKRLLQRKMKLIVHSAFLAGEFNKIHRDSTNSVNYPVSTTYQYTSKGREHLRYALGLKENDKLLLCFGGTRYDKGADIAVNVLNKLPNSYHLLVAGKEEEITFDTLLRLSRANRTRLHTMNKFIDDNEVSNIFSAADIVLLPYRANFAGQSGPLTIAASMGRWIVASNLIVLAETVSKYRLGGVAKDIEEIVQCISGARPATQSDRFCEDSSCLRFSNKIIGFYHHIKCSYHD